MPHDFPLDQWYVAAFAEEVGEKPLARTVCARPMVLFRTASGRIAALADRCPHRAAPLSLGQVLGEEIECPFHGMRFGADGACTLIPCQSHIPPQAAVRAFPVAERDGHVWVWPGEATRADAALVPDMHWMVDPARGVVKGMQELACGWRLAVDNLLDDTHLSFVHRNTIGNAMVAQTPLDVEPIERGLRLKRITVDIPPSALHRKAGGFTTNVDRWFVLTFTAPGTVVIDVGSAPTGTGVPEGRRVGAIEIHSNGTVTPVGPGRCMFFWHSARSFGVGDAGMQATFQTMMERTFQEDADIVEAVQRNLDRHADATPQLNIAADNPTIRFRRMADRMMQEEGT